MTIDAMWLQVSCDQCKKEIEIELETDPKKGGSWPKNNDRLYAHLERKAWTWADGKDFCPEHTPKED